MKKIFVIAFSLLFLSACSTINEDQSISSPSAIDEKTRAQQLKELSRWQVNGKIAFISADDRKSGKIIWYNDSLLKTQRLDLSDSYLGINLLHINSFNDENIVRFDDKEFNSDDLNSLLYQLTGYHFPTQALSFWIKGTKHSNLDTITYNPNTNLPQSLSSQYDGKEWQISYSNYRQVKGYLLPRKITVTQSGITIKIAISEWGI